MAETAPASAAAPGLVEAAGAPVCRTDATGLPEITPCHLPPELWAIVFSHVSGDFYLTTRAAFLAACRAYDAAAQTLRPPEPGVYLGVRAPDGTLCRGRRISAEAFALYEERLQPLGLIAWPAELAAVGLAVTYEIHSISSAPIPPQKVYDLELRALMQSARDISHMAHPHAVREVLAAWVAEHLPEGSDLHGRLREFSEHARRMKNDPTATPGTCHHSIGHEPDISCPDCPPGWKAPMTDSPPPGADTVALVYIMMQETEFDISDGLMRRLAANSIDGPMLLPPWHVTFSRLHEFGATTVPRISGADPGATGEVRLDRIVRLLPAIDVRINALAELLGRLRAAGVAFAPAGENPRREFDAARAALAAILADDEPG